ncbi:hypothetical protein O181_006025 [Austropuccinia psidii MF-1]|uniref:Uncharacterized protein n=1 Tax=Austropuccinia psidii MF-1 TaxID=1389203 RepID=A0A9Q3BJJ6_9BASI|nr:hypothetical protein [Austropuccinia psidii MF-1]
MGRTSLHESGLPKEFWGFVFMLAAHLQNLLPNSRTSLKTPIELFLNRNPCYNQIRLFGEMAYIHILCEKRQKIDDCAVEGCVVMFLSNKKVWLFYISQTKEFLTSVWEMFPKSSDVCNTIRRWSIPWTPKKNEISFMVNSLSLGSFTKEFQDKLMAELLATTPNIVTPKSFKQAITSPKRSQWQDVIWTKL